MKKKKKKKKKKEEEEEEEEHGKMAFVVLVSCVGCNTVASNCVTRHLVLNNRNTEEISRVCFGSWAIIVGRYMTWWTSEF